MNYLLLAFAIISLFAAFHFYSKNLISQSKVINRWWPGYFRRHRPNRHIRRFYGRRHHRRRHHDH